MVADASPLYVWEYDQYMFLSILFCVRVGFLLFLASSSGSSGSYCCSFYNVVPPQWCLLVYKPHEYFSYKYTIIGVMFTNLAIPNWGTTLFLFAFPLPWRKSREEKPIDADVRGNDHISCGA